MAANEYISVSFASGQLGMSVLPTTFPDCLGLTSVEQCQRSSAGYPGQAERGGVRPGDVIVAINGEYVAYEDHQQLINRMKTSPRPMVIQFSRPLQSAWARIKGSGDGVVRSGTLQKPGGLWHRWTDREFRLTRESLAYYDAGEMKKRYNVADLLRVGQSSSSSEAAAFEIVTKEKSILVLADGTQSKLLWMHAIDCVIRKAFDRALPTLRSGAAPSYGGGAAATGDTAAAGTRVGGSRPGFNKQRSVKKVGPYGIILDYCRVEISAGPELGQGSEAELAQLPDFSRLQLFDYTFEREKEIVDRAAAKEDGTTVS